MGLSEFAIGGRAPARQARPRSPEELAALVREADAAHEAVVAFGGRTRIEVGNAPARYDIALDLRDLVGIVKHEPGDLTATVRAGTTLAALSRELARHGQMWPPAEAGRPDTATVGGTLGGATAGPSRLRYGHPRDWLVGVRAVLGDGALVRAGGSVVKNVTGYDLSRLYVGSYGTLAALAEVSLKLWPLPETERTLVASWKTWRDAEEAADELHRRALAIDAAALLDHGAATYLGEEEALLAVRVRGSAAAVERVTADVARVLGAARSDERDPGLWRQIADVPHRAAVALRVTAPESRLREALRDAGAGILRYPGTGIAFLVRERADAEWIAACRAAAEAVEGSCVIERAPLAVRAGLDAWGRPALPSELARRLKAAFDPRGTLSPGRMAGGI